MLGSSSRRLLVGLAAVAVLVAACGTAGSSPSASGGASGAKYKIGFSNTGGTGNGFREEQNCTAKAEALSSGEVSDLTVITHDVKPAQQLQDLRDLIAKGVDAIVFNPSDPDGPQPGAGRGQGRRHQDRGGRRLRDRSRHLQPVQQPDQVRRARRQVAVRAAGRQGHGLLHARHRRPPGRLRPRHRLQERAQGLSRHQRRPDRRWRRHRIGIRRPPPSWPTSSSPAAPTTTSMASGRRASTPRSSTRSRHRARSSCPSSAPTAARSPSSSSTRPTIPT